MSSIFIGSLDSGDTKQLLNADSKALYASGHVSFVREGTLLLQPFDTTRMELIGDPFPIAEQVRFNAVNGRAAFSLLERTLTYRTGEWVDSQLIWFDRSGKRTGALGDSAPYGDIELSPDEKRVAVNVRNRSGGGRTDIWLYEVARGIRTRFTFDPASESAPTWSPTGDRLVFRANPAGHRGLYLRPS